MCKKKPEEKGRYNSCFEYILSNDPKECISKNGLRMRKLISPLVRQVAYKLSGTKLIRVCDTPLPKGPKIFALTHTYSYEDAACGLKAVDEQAYLMTNARRELLYTSDGYALWATGTILIDRLDKENRAAAVDKAVRVLNMGGNVLIFPEGVWNMSQALLVLKLYSGVARMAKGAHVPVIPIATMMYGEQFFVNRGEAINLYEYTQEDGLLLLRDTLASLKWEIMELYGHTTREALLEGMKPSAWWDKHISDYIARQEIYDIEEDWAHFVDDEDKKQAQVAGITLKPNFRNAFLFDKRCCGVVPKRNRIEVEKERVVLKRTVDF